MPLLRHAHPLFETPGASWGPALDDALVAQFELLFGLRLPPALVEVLRQSNGGRLRRTSLGEQAGRRPLRVRDLAGIGYDEGLEASSRLCEEWGYPRPSLVLSTEGPVATLLDYRRCGPHGEPAVVFVDTDHEVAGRPVEWTVAPSVAAMLQRLAPWHPRTVLWLAGLDADATLELLRALGGSGPVRPDHEGGQSLGLPRWSGSDDGTARVRVVPWLWPDGARRFPELPTTGTLVQATVAAEEVGDWLASIEERLPAGSLLVHQAGED
jgi:hypothetical protein